MAMGTERRTSRVNLFSRMCSGSEAGSYLRLMDFVYHSTLCLRAIKRRADLYSDGHGEEDQPRYRDQFHLRNVQWFRGGLVFGAHRLLYHSV